ATALQYRRHEDASRVHVCHHVDVETQPPFVVGGLGAAEHDDSGVRAEEVDGPEACLGRFDQRAYLRLVRDVAWHREAGHGEAIDLPGDLVDAPFVSI